MVSRWQSFWFDEVSAYAIGAIRIAFGLTMVAWTLAWYPDLQTFFGPKGIDPAAPKYTWGPLAWATTEQHVLVAWGALLVASIALTVGWQSRIAAVAVWVLMLGFERRDSWGLTASDIVLRIEALFLVLAPSGAAFSIDRRRTSGTFWSAELMSAWSLRLFQIQLSVIYLFTAQMKLAGTTWLDGSAVSYALQLYDLRIFTPPSWILGNGLIINVLTWGGLALEISMGVLVWNRRWCPRVLWAGFVMHLILLITVGIGFFSFAMYILYLAFLSPEWVRRAGLDQAFRAERHDEQDRRELDRAEHDRNDADHYGGDR